jgi:hypothetical protein
MFPSSANRVRRHTDDEVNRTIVRDIERSIEHHADHPGEISGRLRDLDAEWDVERVLEANAATLILVGVTLGAVRDRRWLALPAGVAAFLLQHALQGWCPPLPVLRRLGFRTVYEIERERTALRILRGDVGGGDAGDRTARAHDFARTNWPVD